MDSRWLHLLKKESNFFFKHIFYLKLSIISVFAEDKIISTPLLNIEEIKPSFEVYDEKNENSTIQNLKNKCLGTDLLNLTSPRAALAHPRVPTRKSSDLIPTFRLFYKITEGP